MSWARQALPQMHRHCKWLDHDRKTDAGVWGDSALTEEENKYVPPDHLWCRFLKKLVLHDHADLFSCWFLSLITVLRFKLFAIKDN